jgi:hypothetical protein
MLCVADADCVCDVSNGLARVKALLRSISLGLDTEALDVDDLAFRLDAAKAAVWAVEELVEDHQQKLSDFYNLVLLPHVLWHDHPKRGDPATN